MPAGNCSHGLPGDPNDDQETYPSAWDAYALAQKTLSGAGLATSSWNYTYTSGNGDTTTVAGPGKYERHTFGNTFRTDEGKALRVEVGDSASQILSKTSYTYSYDTTGVPYHTPLGDSGQWRSDNFTEEFVRPMIAKVVTQQDRDFFWVVDETCGGATGLCLDAYARPTKVIKASAVADTIDLLPPTATPALSVTPALSSSGNATASWTDVPYASSYQLQERQGTGAWSMIHNGAGISKTISGKANGNWSYQARGCNSQGCGSWSNIVAIVVAVPPSSAPVLSAPASSSTGNFSVTWGAVTRATRYELDERVNGGTWIGIYNGSGTSMARAVNTGTYQYRARACNVGGCSANSAAVTTAVNAPPQPPAPPASIYASASSVAKNEAFTVSWYASPGATSYELQRNRSQVGWNPASPPGPATSASQSLPLSGDYAFRVRACNANGCGAYTPTITVYVGTDNLTDPGEDGQEEEATP